jgi:hypothetical protein
MAEWLWRVAQDILNIFLVETSVRLLIGKPAGVRIPFLSSSFFFNFILHHFGVCGLDSRSDGKSQTERAGCINSHV